MRGQTLDLLHAGVRNLAPRKDLEPGIRHVRITSERHQRRSAVDVIGHPVANVFKQSHAPMLRQEIARCKRQEMPPGPRQTLNMSLDYRAVLRTNLRAVFAVHGDTTATASRKARYLDGPKRGRTISERSLRYFLEEGGPSPSLDALAAIAGAYDLMPWQLLVPGLDPGNPPYLALSDAERALYADFRRLKAKLADQ